MIEGVLMGTAKIGSYKEIEVIHETSKRLQRIMPPDQLAQEIIKIFEKILHYELGAVLLIDKETHELNPYAVSDQGKGTTFIDEDKEYITSQGIKIGTGITGYVAKTGESVRTGDVREDSRYYSIRDFIRSELCVPIIVEEQIIGVVNTETPRENAYSENDQLVLEIIASHIGIAIINARLYEEAQKEITTRLQYDSRLKALQLYSPKLFSVKTMFELAKITLDLIDDILGFDRSGFLMIEGNYLKQLYGKPRGVFHVPLSGRGITVRTAITGETQLVRDVSLDPDYLVAETVTELLPALSELCVPVIVKDEVVALINVESKELNHFGDEDKDILELIASNVSASITQMRSLEESKRLEKELNEERVKVEIASQLDRLKTQFMNTATHELRTPVTSIFGYIELILEDQNRTIAPDIREDLDVVLRNSKRLVILTNDLLDVQRINSGRFEINLKQVDLVNTINEVIEELSPLFDVKNQVIIVKAPTELSVQVDDIRISQLLINLLRNANKFTPEEGNITVTVEQFENHVQISVKDSGIGLSMENIGKLFKSFPGIHHGLNVSSTGLGLSIAKGIVELHGGEIWAESEGNGKGSTFRFTIPNRR